MPRPKSITRDTMLERALAHFWAHGFASTSMDHLVEATGASRHAIYSEFGSKDGLFRGVLALYSDTVVTPAFAQVERRSAGLADIAGYWEVQIVRGEAVGLPGPGCLMTNTMTERAPHAPEIARIVAAHNARLQRGFRNALDGPGITGRHRTTKRTADAMATALAVFSNGLWAVSRVVTDARPLRWSAKAMIAELEYGA